MQKSYADRSSTSERYLEQNYNRCAPHNILGFLWVIGLALTILFYHLWWVKGKNVLGSKCEVISAKTKTAHCQNYGNHKSRLRRALNKPKCYYPSWEVRYSTTSRNKKSHVKGGQSFDVMSAYEKLQAYQVGNTYQCYYSTSKSSSVRWDDPGGDYLYYFSVLLFLCSIFPCVCWLIGIPKCYGRLRRWYYGEEKKKSPILLDNQYLSPDTQSPLPPSGNQVSSPPSSMRHSNQEGWNSPHSVSSPHVQQNQHQTPQAWLQSWVGGGATCRQCNAKIGQNYRFCPQCGYPVGHGVEEDLT